MPQSHTFAAIGISILLLTACNSSSDSDGSSNDDGCSHSTAPNGTNITNAYFDNISASCANHAGSYYSQVKDTSNNQCFTGTVSITTGTDTCTFTSNSIPNHDFNDSSAHFANTVKEVTETFYIYKSPSAASSTTDISLQTDNGVMLNGVKLDMLAAGCYGIGDGKIGCNKMATAYRFDPLSTSGGFGADAHNAHTQPDGAYHYHGSPQAMFDATDTSKASPVIGFAADGYPIYGSYFQDAIGTIRKATSSYKKITTRTKTAANGTIPDTNTYPIGTFIDDYEYSSGHGDLDECNGMTNADGQYGYYVTESYPWVIRCFKGTPHASFNKR